MSQACCCDYIPPDVCVDCGPPYLIGNTASSALSITGFSNPGYTVPTVCNEGFFDEYNTNIIYSLTNTNTTLILDRVPDICCWENRLSNTDASIRCAPGGDRGPLICYMECIDTHSIDGDHTYRSEQYFDGAQVCLYSDGVNVYWFPALFANGCVFKDGVYFGSSSATDTCLQYILDDPGYGVMTVEDYCAGLTDTIRGQQIGPHGEIMGYIYLTLFSSGAVA